MTTEDIDQSIVERYDEVAPTLGAALTSNSRNIMMAVAVYVNSFSSLTDDQIGNIIKFLERPDIPPLIKLDGIRDLGRGPMSGHIISETLALQLGTLPFSKIRARDEERKIRLKELNLVTEVEDLPQYFTHLDLEVRGAAIRRLEYLKSFPAKRVALMQCMLQKEYKRKQEALIVKARYLLGTLKKFSGQFTEADIERTEARAYKLLTVSKGTMEDVMEFEHGKWGEDETLFKGDS